MATTPTVPNEAQAASGKHSILLPILCSLIGAGAVGGSVIFFLMHSGKLLSGGQAAPVVVKAEVPTAAVTLDPFLVNLADVGGHSYLRTSLVLTVDAPVADKKAEKKPDAKGAVDYDAAAQRAAMRDTILTVLSSQTADALLATGGKEALKKTLIEQINKAVPGIKVEEIYFTEFLVQR